MFSARGRLTRRCAPIGPRSRAQLLKGCCKKHSPTDIRHNEVTFGLACRSMAGMDLSEGGPGVAAQHYAEWRAITGEYERHQRLPGSDLVDAQNFAANGGAFVWALIRNWFRASSAKSRHSKRSRVRHPRGTQTGRGANGLGIRSTDNQPWLCWNGASLRRRTMRSRARSIICDCLGIDAWRMHCWGPGGSAGGARSAGEGRPGDPQTAVRHAGAFFAEKHFGGRRGSLERTVIDSAEAVNGAGRGFAGVKANQS